jgi:hypothetical protein
MAAGTISSPSPDRDRAPRRRRWIPLSVKGFAAILLLVGIGGPLWIGARGWRLQAAIKGIERAHGSVGTRAGTPDWLPRFVGDPARTWFDRVERVDLGYEKVDDSVLVHLKNLPDVEELKLNDTCITGKGFANLAGLTKLRELDLGDTQVADAGLHHLRGLTRTESLDLYRTHVTDAGLEHLRGLTSLRSLDLGHTRITSAGLEHLRGLVRLKVLSLSGTLVADNALQPLRGLSRLKHLNLSYTRVTDDALADCRR